MPIPPVPEGFTFPPACSTREMLSPAVSTSIVTSDGRLPKKPVSVLMGLQLIRGGLCSRNSASRSLRYSDSTSRRRTCARAFSITSETKPSLNFPTYTSFARPPISNLGCFHLSGRSFCIFGLATAADEVAFAGRRHWLPCDAGRASRGGSPTRPRSRPPAVSRPRAIFTPTKRWPRRVGMVAALAAVYHRARFAWSAQHDPRGCFDLSRSCSLLRGDDGMDIASLDPQTVLA